MSSSEESDDSTDIFEVERIVDSKRKADGTYLYKVQWEGYGREEDSWEPEKNLLTCQEIVDKYWDEQKQLDKDQRNIQATDQQKRRSGRPRRKRVLEPSSSETEDDTPQKQTVSIGLQTEKKKRGRPRKHPPMLSSGLEKRNRGRPRKKQMIEDLSHHDNETTCSDTAEEPDGIPLGMTRLASRELARARGKGSDNQEPSVVGKDGWNLNELEKCKKNGNDDQIKTEHYLVNRNNKPLVIELFSSSQETEHKDQIVIDISSQESEPEKQEQTIVISSQSETEDERNDAGAKPSSLSSSLCRRVGNASVGKLQETNSSMLSIFQSNALISLSEDSLPSISSTANFSTKCCTADSSCNSEYTRVQPRSKRKGPGSFSRSGKVTEKLRRRNTNCAMTSLSEEDTDGRKSPASLADWVQSKSFSNCCKSLLEGAGIHINKIEDLTRKNSVVGAKLCRKGTDVDRLAMVETRGTGDKKVNENVSRERVGSVDDKPTRRTEPNKEKLGDEVENQRAGETEIDEAEEQNLIKIVVNVANEAESGTDEANEQQLIETGTNEEIEEQVMNTELDEASVQGVVGTDTDAAKEPETEISVEPNELQTGTNESNKQRAIATGIDEANERQVIEAGIDEQRAVETEIDEANERQVIEAGIDEQRTVETGIDEANERQVIEAGIDEQRAVETGIDEANERQVIEAGIDEQRAVETGIDEANERQVIEAGIDEQRAVETGINETRKQQVTETVTVKTQADDDEKQHSKILSSLKTSKIVSNLQAIVSKIDLKSDLLLKPSNHELVSCDSIKENNFPGPDFVQSSVLSSCVVDSEGAGLVLSKSADKQTIPAVVKKTETKTTEQKKQPGFCQTDSWQATSKNIEELHEKDFRIWNTLNTTRDETLLKSECELTSSSDLCESSRTNALRDKSNSGPIQEQGLLKKNSKFSPGSSEQNITRDVLNASLTAKEREKSQKKEKRKASQSTVIGNEHMVKPNVTRPPSHQVIELIEDRRAPNSPQSSVKSKSLAAKPMDGDLLGSIMKHSGAEEDKKASPPSPPSPPKTLTNDSSSVIKDKATILLELENAPTPEASEDEEELSDFEFELDDYSPSFLPEHAGKEKEIPPLFVSPMDVPFAALKLAVKEGNVLTVKRALAAGCDLEKPDGTSGMTLLMWAAAAGQDDIIKLLLLYGAEVNAKQKNGTTPLMHACEQGFATAVQSLLDADSHINAQQMSGETALMKACRKGHSDVVELLLRNGADTKIRSNFAQTAKQFALRFQPIQLHNMLHDHDKRLASILEASLTKCLGSAGSLLTPPLVPYRCLSPEETDEMSFKFSFKPDDLSEGSEAVLFCVRADFSQEDVCLSFSGDNGVRTVLLKGKIQMPVLHGNRSVFVLKPDAGSNELCVQTYPSKCKLFVSVYAVNCNTGTNHNDQNT